MLGLCVFDVWLVDSLKVFCVRWNSWVVECMCCCEVCRMVDRCLEEFFVVLSRCDVSLYCWDCKCFRVYNWVDLVWFIMGIFLFVMLFGKLFNVKKCIVWRLRLKVRCKFFCIKLLNKNWVKVCMGMLCFCILSFRLLNGLFFSRSLVCVLRIGYRILLKVRRFSCVMRCFFWW